MQLIFLSEQDLSVLDYGYATDDFDIILDALVPQKSKFTVNKQSLKAKVGDLLLVKEKGYTAKLTDVISVVVPDKPNGLNELLRILTENNIEIDYLYVFLGKNNLGAQAILKSPNIEEVETLLLNNYY